MRFGHVTGERVAGFTIDRRAVKAGATRFAHGAPAECVRIELRTEPKDRLTRDVRLPPVVLDPAKSAVATQFENGQVRILRVMCVARETCQAARAASWIDVVMSGPRRGRVVTPQSWRGRWNWCGSS